MTTEPNAASGGSESELQVLRDLKRQSAVVLLEHMLATSMDMLARCETQAKASRGDRLGPVYAAAQLLHANANLAKAFAHVGCVETRHRSIIEQVQPAGGRKGELNWGSPPYPQDQDDARTRLKKKVDALLESNRLEQERMDGLNIGCCI